MMTMGVKKKEDYAIGSSSFHFNYPLLDFSDDKSSLGFMELLGVQEYSPLLDLPLGSNVELLPTSDVKELPQTKKDWSEVTNQQPATPNSSSISSASSEALNDEQKNRTVDQTHDEHKKTKEQYVSFSNVLILSRLFKILLFTSFCVVIWLFKPRIRILKKKKKKKKSGDGKKFIRAPNAFEISY